MSSAGVIDTLFKLGVEHKLFIEKYTNIKELEHDNLSLLKNVKKESSWDEYQTIVNRNVVSWSCGGSCHGWDRSFSIDLDLRSILNGEGYAEIDD